MRTPMTAPPCHKSGHVVVGDVREQLFLAEMLDQPR